MFAFVQNPLVPIPVHFTKVPTWPCYGELPFPWALSSSTNLLPCHRDIQILNGGPLSLVLEPVTPCEFVPPLCYCKSLQRIWTLGILLGPVELSSKFVFLVVPCCMSAQWLSHSSSPRKGIRCDTISILTRISDLMWKYYIFQARFPSDTWAQRPWD